MDRLDDLREQVEFIDAHLRAIHETAGETRSLTADEQSRWDDGVWLREALIAEGIALQERRDVVAAAHQAGSTETGSPDSTRDAPNFHRDINPYDPEYRARVGDREAAIRAVGQSPDMDGDAQTEAERKVRLEGTPEMRGISRYVLAHNDPAYARAFFKLASQRQHAITPEESAALARADEVKRAMSLTDTEGGFLIPTFLDPTVILTVDGSTNPFRRISRVVPITGDNWNGVTSAGISVSWDTEGAEVSDDAPTIGKPSITPHKASGFVPISIEAYEDIAGAGGEIAREFMQAKDDLEAAAFATGTGSDQPIGIVTALVGTASATNMATNGSIAAADIFKARRHLGPRYRGRASWVMNLAINDEVRALGSSDNFYSQTVQLPGLAVDQLLAQAVYEASAMDDSLSTTTDNAVVYGDFSNYVIADRVGMSVEFIPHLFATGNNRPSGQRGWYTHWRVGADSVNDNGFTLLFNPNTAF